MIPLLAAGGAVFARVGPLQPFYDLVQPVFVPLFNAVAGFGLWLFKCGCPQMLAIAVVLYLYFGALIAPLVIVKWIREARKV